MAKIKKRIENLELEKAKDELNGKSLYKGKRSQFKEMLLWHTIHTATGILVEAYEVTEKIFKLASNDSDYQIALARRAITMYEAGNHELFREVIEKIDSNIKKDRGEALLAESLKAYALKNSGQPVEAKKLLRTALDTYGEGPEAIIAYINLAFYEDLDGNTREALHILNKAKIELDKLNNKLFVSSLYHNLIVLLLKSDDTKQAEAMLKEYEEKIDKKNKDQYLDFLNEKLIFARQISKASIIEDVYKTFRDQIQPYVSYEKVLLLTINLLRMESGNKGKTKENLLSIQKRLDSVFGLKFPNNWYAIKEILYALKELEKDGIDKAWDDLYERLLGKIDELKSEVEEFRSNIPEAIFSMHYDWIMEELTLHKYSARKEADYNDKFFAKLFSLADSMIKIASDAQNDLFIARSCALYCDEFSAFGRIMGKGSLEKFGLAAGEYLLELERIAEAHPAENDYAEFAIASGRFALLVEENFQKAQMWYNEFEKRKISALHYAPWLRRYFEELKAALLCRRSDPRRS
ncbi:hypothetical protein SDC9_87172 [bioreactor metagenome]|uniref:MalT-like TPR region domain-containing protein n=1 Tax=bioreactor metagenome TaxID=1076179 RepID=A0A644ZJM7_9ZZZZ